MDTPTTPPSSTPETASANTTSTSSSPAAEQARLRKERREAKIKTGGSARLGKITSMGGRSQEPVAAPPAPPVERVSAPTADPTKAQTGQRPFSPESHALPRNPMSHQQQSEEQLRQRMLQFQGPPVGQGVPPPQQQQQQQPQQQQGPPGNEDPMMALLEQLMGGGGGSSGGPGGGGGGGLPPSLAQALGQAQAGQGLSAATTDGDYGYVWRLVHAVLALALGLYAVASTSFSSAAAQRRQPGIASEIDDGGARLFWYFATAELLLQSGRFFLEKGRLRGHPVLTALAPLVPEPWRARMLVLGRYGVIYSTVVADAMVVLFVLGVAAWWKGAGA